MKWYTSVYLGIPILILFVSFASAALLENLTLYHEFDDTVENVTGRFNLTAGGSPTIISTNSLIGNSINVTNQSDFNYYNITGTAGNGLNISNTNFSISIWLYTYTTGAIKTFYEKHVDGGAQNGWSGSKAANGSLNSEDVQRF